MRGSVFSFALFLAVVLGLPASAAKGPKCFPREGHCVAVTVNGQSAVAMNKKRLRAIKALEELSRYADEARYELIEPLSGDLEIRAAPVAGSEGWFGETGSVEAAVVPLDQVELVTEDHAVADSSVLIGDKPAVTVGSFLQDDHLPPGRYLLRVKLRGADNWDRQTLYVTVED